MKIRRVPVHHGDQGGNVAVAFAGGILGNFFREVAVQMIEGLEAWWGS